MNLKIAIVEDKQDVREGLVFLLNRSPGLECVFACASGEEAVARLPAVQPDVILLDIQLSGALSGLDCIGRLNAAIPAVRIVMLTVFDQPEIIFRALQLGAVGYLRKSSSSAEIISTIQDVHQGGARISPDLARLVFSAFQNPSPVSVELQKLSERERHVLELRAQGYDTAEIAARFDISKETVKCHCRSIYQKLQVHTANQAISKVYPDKKYQAIVRNVSDGQAL